MNPPDSDRAPIFVVGTGRSGTTLLRLMLNAHPRIYLTHEAMFWVLRQALPRTGDAAAWFARYAQTFSFAWLNLDPEVVRRELPPGLPRKHLAQVFAAVMRAKARQMGKPRYGDKTPFHTAHVKRIFADFPDARIIHIVRDPRATVASLLRMPWGPSTAGIAALNWKLDAQGTRRHADRVCVVRLEDLLAAPDREMARILQFVGESWDDAVLEHARFAIANDVPPFPWLTSAAESRRDRGVGDAWRQFLTPEWLRNIERQGRGAMRRLGYEPATLEPEPSRWAQIRAGLRDLPEGLRYARRLLRAIRTLRKSSDAAACQRQFLALNPQAWAHYPGFEIVDPPVVAG